MQESDSHEPNFSSTFSSNSVVESGLVLGYWNVIGILGTSMSIIVQSSNAKIRAESVKSDCKVRV